MILPLASPDTKFLFDFVNAFEDIPVSSRELEVPSSLGELNGETERVNTFVNSV